MSATVYRDGGKFSRRLNRESTERHSQEATDGQHHIQQTAQQREH